MKFGQYTKMIYNVDYKSELENSEFNYAVTNSKFFSQRKQYRWTFSRGIFPYSMNNNFFLSACARVELLSPRAVQYFGLGQILKQ